MTKMLLERGADVAAQTGDGLTPVMIAALKGQGHFCVTKLLFEAGFAQPLYHKWKKLVAAVSADENENE